MSLTRRHDSNCPIPYRGECLEFSTDGTRLGVGIAHQMGTDDEDEITRMGIEERSLIAKAHLTGMEEEQADWEADEDD